MRNIIKKIFGNLMCVVMLYAIFIMILLAGQFVPRSYIRDNIWKSYKIMDEEGLYADGLDTYTDSLFLNAAVTRYPGNIIERAFSNAYTKGEEEYPLDGLPYIYDEWPLSHKDATIETYTRYWVGSLVFVKFLFLFFDIRVIRIILLLTIFVLLVITIKEMTQKLGFEYSIAFAISFLVYDYVRNSRGFSYYFDYALLLIGCLVILRMHSLENINKLASYYFVLGALTSYLGYWTTPIITLAYPLIIYVSLSHRNKKNLLDIIYFSSMWTGGVVVTIALKQFLSVLIFGEQSGVAHMKHWVGEDVSISERLATVIERFSNSVLSVALSSSAISVITIATVIIIILCKANSEYVLRSNNNLIDKVIVCLIACFPLVWEFVFYAHGNHGFVQQMYAITLFALLTLAFQKLSVSMRKG